MKSSRRISALLAVIVLIFTMLPMCINAGALNVKFIKKSVSLEEGEVYNMKSNYSVATDGSETVTKTTWSSNDTSVAFVDSKGTVIAKKNGAAVITISVSSSKGSASDYCMVTVKGKTTTTAPKTTSPKTTKHTTTKSHSTTQPTQTTGTNPTSVLPTVSDTQMVYLTVGKTTKLKPSIGGNVVFVSGDQSIATVSSSGVVKAIGAGQTWIQAYNSSAVQKYQINISAAAVEATTLKNGQTTRPAKQTEPQTVSLVNDVEKGSYAHNQTSARIEEEYTKPKTSTDSITKILLAIGFVALIVIIILIIYNVRKNKNEDRYYTENEINDGIESENDASQTNDENQDYSKFKHDSDDEETKFYL